MRVSVWLMPMPMSDRIAIKGVYSDRQLAVEAMSKYKGIPTGWIEDHEVEWRTMPMTIAPGGAIYGAPVVYIDVPPATESLMHLRRLLAKGSETSESGAGGCHWCMGSPEGPHQPDCEYAAARAFLDSITTPTTPAETPTQE